MKTGGEYGYTLIEFVVVLTLISVLGGFVYGSYLLSLRWNDFWQNRLVLENTAHLMVHHISQDIRRADRILHEADSLWRVFVPPTLLVEYQFIHDKVYRNGRLVSGSNLQVLAFSIVLSPDGKDPEGEMIDGKLVHIRLELASNQFIVALNTSVAMRQPARWPQKLREQKGTASQDV